MAFTVKNTNVQRSAGVTGGGQVILQQWTHVTRASGLLPATTTEMLFRVFGGRVLIHYMLGQVTVICDSTDPVLKITSKALSNASVAVGTAVDVASTTTLASKEVGSMFTVLGSGAALIVNNAGAGLSTLGRVTWVAPQGEIYATTGGTNLTGFVKYDLWYQPLDEGAYVVGQPVATAII